MVRLVDWGPWLATRRAAAHAARRARARRRRDRRPDDRRARGRRRRRGGRAASLGGRHAHRGRCRALGARRRLRAASGFDGEVVDLQPVPGGRAPDALHRLRGRLIDDGPSFWDFVRRRGALPDGLRAVRLRPAAVDGASDQRPRGRPDADAAPDRGGPHAGERPRRRRRRRRRGGRRGDRDARARGARRAARRRRAPPAAVQVVLDRSGSMDGERLDAAQAGARARSSTASTRATASASSPSTTRSQVVVPAGPLTDKHAAAARSRRSHAGGMTNLSGGLLRGLQEARRVAGDAGATLLLLSDGHANAGETDPDRLAARRRRRARRTASRPRPSASASTTTSCCSPRSPAAGRATTSSPSTATARPPRSPARSTACCRRPCRPRA